MSIALNAAPGAQPVIGIEQEAGTFGTFQAATQASAAASAFEQAMTGFSPFAALEGSPLAAMRAAGLIPDVGPILPPPSLPGYLGGHPAAHVAQAITVGWPTADGPRNQEVAIGTPLTLEGYMGG